MNIIEQINQEQIQKLSDDHDIPAFGPGDTVRVDVKVIEGSRERIQAFEGVCIARNNDGINSSSMVAQPSLLVPQSHEQALEARRLSEGKSPAFGDCFQGTRTTGSLA